MTFNTNGNVTHAGWRTVIGPHIPWECPSCELLNPGYRKQCQLCNLKREAAIELSERTEGRETNQGSIYS